MIFYTDCIILVSEQECMRVHVIAHLFQDLVLQYFHFSHSNEFEVTFHRCNNFTFLITNDVEHTFWCLLVIFVFSFIKRLFKIFSHFKNWVIILLFYKVFYILWTHAIYQIYCKYFFPI